MDKEILIRTILLTVASGFALGQQIGTSQKLPWLGIVGAVVGGVVAVLYDVLAFGMKNNSAGEGENG